MLTGLLYFQKCKWTKKTFTFSQWKKVFSFTIDMGLMTLFPLSVLSASGSLSDMTRFKKIWTESCLAIFFDLDRKYSWINCVQFKHSQIIFSFYSDKQVKWSWKWRQSYASNMQYIFEFQNQVTRCTVNMFSQMSSFIWTDQNHIA